MSEQTLATDRLELWTWSPGDVPDVIDLNSQSEVTRFLISDDDGLWSEQECRRRLEIWIAQHEIQGYGK